MKRVDDIKVRDDGDEEMVCGIVLFKGNLRWTEGSKLVAYNLINMQFVIPGPRGEIVRIRGTEEPDAWLEWAPFRLSNAYGYLTEPYDDDDRLYNPESGAYVGDENNPPLPTDEEIDAMQSLADTESIRDMQAELATSIDDRRRNRCRPKRG